MFDDIESDDELEEFIQKYQPSRLSRRELNNAKARIRGAINRESKASQKRAQEMAASIINHASQRSLLENSRSTQRMRKAHGVLIGVSKLASSVLSTLDVRVPIHVESDKNTSVASAMTDFSSININVNLDNYNADDRHRLASLIHMTKGLVYHEGGHIKWTTPFPKLVELSGRDDISISSRYRLTRAWNVLEDQRMETAMCTISPVMGKYFTNIVLNVVLNLSDMGANWPWIAGRTYLPSDIRQIIRDAAEERDQHGIVDQLTACVMGYRRSKCPKEMLNYVIQFSSLLELWGSSPRGADLHNWEYSETFQDSPAPDSIPDVDDYPSEKPSPGVTRPTKEAPADSAEDTDDNAKPDTEKPKDSPSAGTGAPASGGNVTPSVEEEDRKQEKQLTERIAEEVNKNIQNVKEDEIDDFISTVNEHSAKVVLTDPTINTMNEYETSETTKVANSMVSVLEKLVVHVEPTWHSHMEEGVLDPTLFKLREPGDTNFWSGLDGNGNNGHDLALSVLVDSSGSMINQMNKASISAIGIRKACEMLGIPCTVTTFNDDVYMVADATEDVGYIKMSATGGTSVMNAMMALEEQRQGKTYHLVVILTDGEWSDVTDTRMWSSPTRSITIVGLGYGMEAHVSNKGADHWMVINDLMDLPNIVTDSLVSYFV